MLVKNTYELVGNTPIIELRHVEEEFGLSCRLFAKVELFNPAGPHKIQGIGQDLSLKF